MKQKFKAVLFDFDGVIADTMQQNYAAWQAAFRTHYVELAPEDYFPLEGSGPRQIARVLCNKLGLDETLSTNIAEAKDSLMAKTPVLKVYPEIPNLLKQLVLNGIRCALVTGAARRRIEMTLPGGLAHYFTVITTSDDVQNTKPDPEPYLVTANKLKLSPKECIVVENAPLGIASAKAGGFHCIAIKTTLSDAHLAEASEILPNHKALSQHLLKNS